MLKYVLSAATMATIVSPLIGQTQYTQQRTQFTIENRFPRAGKIELGGQYEFTETNDKFEPPDGGNTHMLSAEGRYGLAENFVLRGRLPIGASASDADNVSAKYGFGDIKIGIAGLVFENGVKTTFIIPHVDLQIGTGSREDNLETGETRLIPGISVGMESLSYRNWTWIFDASFAVSSENQNVFIGSISSIMEMSEQFSLLLESRLLDGDLYRETPIEIQLGLVFNPTEALQLGWFIGGGVNSDRDIFSNIRFDYTILDDPFEDEELDEVETP